MKKPKILKAASLAVIQTIAITAGAFSANAEPSAENMTGDRHFRLRYVINIAELDSAFEDNSQRITRLQDFLNEVKNDSLITITGVDFRGTASPDGSYEFNVWLSENRLRTFKELVARYVDIPDSLIHAETSAIPWDEFRQKVEESSLPAKGRILEIIDEGPNLVPWVGGKHIDARLQKLKRLDNGEVWNQLRKPILYDLRYGDAVFYLDYMTPLQNPGYLPLQTAAIAVPQLLPLPAAKSYETWIPNLYLKTNFIGWVMGSVNLGFEADLARHWSFTIPVYYCAWDYFKSTIKFRNFTIQPEFRYWPNANGYNHGFFVGIHAGMMAYNFAVDGKYRYQDRKGTHPALGGGIGIGYRKAISKNQRWHMEFTAGAGAYKLDYDVYENTPNYKEGQWVRRKKKMFYGLDQLAITLSYSFPQKKREKTIEKGGAL